MHSGGSEQVKPRRGHARHVGLFKLLVAILMKSLRPLAKNWGQVCSASPMKMASAKPSK